MHSICGRGFIRSVLVDQEKERIINSPAGSTRMNMMCCLLCSLCSGRRGRELHHRTTVRPQPESRLSGDTGLREQPGGEDRGDVLCESQILMNFSCSSQYKLLYLKHVLSCNFSS